MAPKNDHLLLNSIVLALFFIRFLPHLNGLTLSALPTEAAQDHARYWVDEPIRAFDRKRRSASDCAQLWAAAESRRKQVGAAGGGTRKSETNRDNDGEVSRHWTL